MRRRRRRIAGEEATSNQYNNSKWQSAFSYESVNMFFILIQTTTQGKGKGKAKAIRQLFISLKSHCLQGKLLQPKHPFSPLKYLLSFDGHISTSPYDFQMSLTIAIGTSQRIANGGIKPNCYSSLSLCSINQSLVT